MLAKKASEYSLEDVLKYLTDMPIVRDSGIELKKLVKAKGIDETELKRKYSKSIYEWLNGNRLPSRENAIKLCFDLKLDEEEARRFLQRTCGHNWFHMRDYKDIIFYFCLSNNLSHEKAIVLINEYKEVESINYRKSEPTESFTSMLRKKVVNLSPTEEDLTTFLDENAEKFGIFRNTAYDYFKTFFDTLQKEMTLQRNNFDEDKYARMETSFQEVCCAMTMEIPEEINEKQRDFLKNIIGENVPTRQTLVPIYNRTPDKNGNIPQIKRKPLLMIWMLVNEYTELDRKIDRVNLVLEKCGMPMLDSKNPFDWLYMYALAAEERGEGTASEQIELLIDEICNG
jgi:hypothetical protein